MKYFYLYFKNPIWPPAAILKTEFEVGSLDKSFCIDLRNICAKGNICTIIWSQILLVPLLEQKFSKITSRQVTALKRRHDRSDKGFPRRNA